MNKDGDKLFTVGKLAQKCGVTVRTLQYYDTTGLLVPSEYSEGGRRMYGWRDIIRLQQILFFKSLGFSLEEIRDRLFPTESANGMRQLFKQQKEVLIEQLFHIQEAVKLLDNVIDEINIGSEIDMDTLFAIMEATKMGNPYSFMIRHFSKEQIQHFFNHFDDEDAAAEFNKSSQALFAKLIELYERNEDPEGIESQNMAAEYWDLVMLLTKGDPELIHNMFTVSANDNNWPSGVNVLKEATKSFLGRAISAYIKNNNIKLSFMEDDKYE